ncbi:MAG: hypothetical protein U0903_18980 [Planctomycetales bacterium]
MATAKTKGPDKQEVCKKVIASLKKKYPAAAKYPTFPVMETMMFAVCLENNTLEQAQAAYDKIANSFHDRNELRVSSIEEIEEIFQEWPEPEVRALRLRDVLHHVFETTYSFDYDSLKRKTLEQAVKALSKVRSLSWFVRSYVLQSSLGAHLLPIDNRMHAILCWLDLGSHEGGPEQTAEGLRGFIRKADGPEFTHVLRLVSNDPAYRQILQNYKKIHADGAWEGVPTLARLDALVKGDWQRKAPKKPKPKAPPPPAPAAPAKKPKAPPAPPPKAKPKPAPKPKAPAKKESKPARKDVSKSKGKRGGR